MPKAIRIHEHGDPEVMRWEEFDPGPPGPEEARVRHTAIGVNYIDVYDRTGLYPGALPSGLGREAAGVVEAVGRGVRGLRAGARVAYVLPSPGSYADVRNVPAERLIRIPAGITDEQAAAILLKGLTAHYLLRRTCRVKRGHTILFHAAAGGVGLLACQWARSLGARVIGVAGSEEKARLARRHGCRHVIVGRDADLAAAVKRFTRGAGVDVVYDSVGQATFHASLDCLKPLGTMVSFGNASGPVPPFAPLELTRRGSLFFTRPALFHYIATRDALERAARELFGVVRRRIVRIRIGRRHRLQDAPAAHRELEARRTAGSIVLVP